MRRTRNRKLFLAWTATVVSTMLTLTLGSAYGLIRASGADSLAEEGTSGVVAPDADLYTLTGRSGLNIPDTTELLVGSGPDGVSVAYLRFPVGGPVEATDATLTVEVTRARVGDLVELTQVSPEWTETGVTADNAPRFGRVLDAQHVTEPGTVVFDVSAADLSGAVVAFALTTPSADGQFRLAAREGGPASTLRVPAAVPTVPSAPAPSASDAPVPAPSPSGVPLSPSASSADVSAAPHPSVASPSAEPGAPSNDLDAVPTVAPAAPPTVAPADPGEVPALPPTAVPAAPGTDGPRVDDPAAPASAPVPTPQPPPGVGDGTGGPGEGLWLDRPYPVFPTGPMYPIAPAPSGDCVVGEKLVPTCGALQGIAPAGKTPVSKTAALLEYEVKVDRRQHVYHSYHRGVSGMFPSADEIAVARDPLGERLLFINWKPKQATWAEIAAGDPETDDYLDRVAAHIKQNFDQPFFFTVHHEPEDDVRQSDGSGYRAEDYAAMFRYVVERLRAGGAEKIVSVIVYMAYLKWLTQPWHEKLYPGDDVVDWVAWDTYGYSDPGYGHGDFAELVNRTSGSKPDWPGTYRWAAQAYPDKPLMIGEWGVWFSKKNPNHQAKVFDDAAAQLNLFPRLKAVLYFESPVAEGRSSQVDETRHGLVAFQRYCSAPAFDVRLR